MRYLFLVFALMLTACAGAAGTDSGVTLRDDHLLTTEAGIDASVEASVASIIARPIHRAPVTFPLSVYTQKGKVYGELTVSPAALQARERRMIVLVPGTLANGGGYYSVEVEGYNTVDLLARRGAFVLVVDLPGTGKSYKPHGASIRVTEQAAAVRALARPIALALGVQGVDVYGETGVGGNVALMLARENWIRSIVGSAMFYKQFGPAMGEAGYFDPAFRAVLDSLPNGYMPNDPVALETVFFAAAPDHVRPLAVAATVGEAPWVIPSSPFYDLLDLSGPDTPTTYRLADPIVEAAPARAPALFIQGVPDFVGDVAGTYEMANEYGTTGGGTAQVIELQGATHLMRFDEGISDGPSSPFWQPILAFLDL